MKIPSVTAELSYSDGRTDRETDRRTWRSSYSLFAVLFNL